MSDLVTRLRSPWHHGDCKQAADEIERLRAALALARDRLQDMLAGDDGQAWDEARKAMRAIEAPLAGAPEPPKEASAVFSTPFQRSELAGNGKPCPNNHDPDCRWPQCVCMERAAAAMDQQEQAR